MLLAILLTLGHGFYHVFFGNSLIGLVSLIACAFMGMALWKTLSDCVALPFIYGFFIFTTFALFLTSYYYGVRGLVLLFPLIASFFSVFSSRVALFISAIVGAVGLVVSLNVLEPFFVFRIVIALVVTLAFFMAFSGALARLYDEVSHQENQNDLTTLTYRKGLNQWLENLSSVKANKGNIIKFTHSFSKINVVFIQLLAIALTLAYSLAHLLFDNLAIGVVSFVACLFSSASLWKTLKGGSILPYLYGFFFFISIALILTSYYFGIRGLILFYPLSAAFFYTFNSRLAIVISLILATAGLIASTNTLELSIVIRNAVALMVTLAFYMAFSDALAKKYAELAYQASHDYLTGLPNRRGFNHWLENQFTLNKQVENSVYLFFVNVDDFKRINDNLGHAFGDELLKSLALRMQDICKKNNYMDNGILSRMSGNEFALAIYEQELSQEVVSQNLITAMDKPFAVAFTNIQIEISIGSAKGSMDKTPQDLMRNADAALLHAKKYGKNRFAVFNKTIANSLERDINIDKGLRYSIDNNEFYLNFMPIFENSSSIVAVEVLIRSRCELLKGFGPDDYIPVAEKSGLIQMVDLWVIEKTLTYMVEWYESGGDKNLSFSVNISGQELENENFPEQLKSLLDKYQVDVTRLTLEVTETALIENLHFSASVIKQIQSMGVKVSLDDFGTGYMGFKQLMNYPVDYLKIDKSFMPSIKDIDNRNANMLDILLDIAQLYNLSVVAEGVEYQQQLTYLSERKCEYFQGYLLSMPLVWKEFVEKYQQIELRGSDSGMI